MAKRLNRNRKKDKDENRLKSRSGKSRIISPGKAVYTEGGTKRVINFGEFRRDSKGRWAEKPGSNDTEQENKTTKQDPKQFHIGGRWDAIRDPEERRRRQIEEGGLDFNAFDPLPPNLRVPEGTKGLSPQLAQRQQEYLRNKQLAFERAILSARQEEVTNSLANGNINSENLKYFVSEEKIKEIKEYVRNYINFAEKKMEDNINSQPTVFGTSFPSCEI